MLSREAVLEDLCRELFKLDRRIRYAAVMDTQGKVKAGGMRRGVRSLEPRSEELRLQVYLLSLSGINDSWTPYYGRVLFSVVRRELLIIGVFPVGEDIVVVSAEPDFPLEGFVRIRDLVLERMGAPRA
ncbi:MAG: hypothetical protein C4339_01695 [Nitrososphaerota archaeon]